MPLSFNILNALLISFFCFFARNLILRSDQVENIFSFLFTIPSPLQGASINILSKFSFIIRPLTLVIIADMLFFSIFSLNLIILFLLISLDTMYVWLSVISAIRIVFVPGA